MYFCLQNIVVCVLMEMMSSYAIVILWTVKCACLAMYGICELFCIDKSQCIAVFADAQWVVGSNPYMWPGSTLMNIDCLWSVVSIYFMVMYLIMV